MFPIVVSKRTLLLLGRGSSEEPLLPNMLYATIIIATATKTATTINISFVLLLFFLRGLLRRDLLGLISNRYTLQ
ncbi:MAG: hypothetical protein CW716_09775 [Candidatus Bathyarchaeum sp.]|nr:MAG: hypothetical protein CW716_09775 [Candidatus Bathyarchaeum sp.]